MIWVFEEYQWGWKVGKLKWKNAGTKLNILKQSKKEERWLWITRNKIWTKTTWNYNRIEHFGWDTHLRRDFYGNERQEMDVRCCQEEIMVIKKSWCTKSFWKIFYDISWRSFINIWYCHRSISSILLSPI